MEIKNILPPHARALATLDTPALYTRIETLSQALQIMGLHDLETVMALIIAGLSAITLIANGKTFTAEELMAIQAKAREMIMELAKEHPDLAFTNEN